MIEAKAHPDQVHTKENVIDSEQSSLTPSPMWKLHKSISQLASSHNRDTKENDPHLWSCRVSTASNGIHPQNKASAPRPPSDPESKCKG